MARRRTFNQQIRDGSAKGERARREWMKEHDKTSSAKRLDRDIKEMVQARTEERQRHEDSLLEITQPRRIR